VLFNTNDINAKYIDEDEVPRTRQARAAYMRAKLGMPARAPSAPAKSSGRSSNHKCSDCKLIHPVIPCSFCGSPLPDHDEFDVGTAEKAENDHEGDDDEHDEAYVTSSPRNLPLIDVE
jgi:hypothetical protein